MEDIAFLNNAAATYDEIAENGPGVYPLPFDPPRIGMAERVDATVYNPVSHDIMEVANIIYERHLDGRPPERAYWVGRKLRNCIFGVIKSCTILKFRPGDSKIPWEVTEGRAAVKVMAWQKMRNIRHVEDPQKEISAMQVVCRNGTHPHVIYPLDVLEDEDYLLLFMPYCSSGELFSLVQQAGRFPEPMARYWFRQILDGLCHLQRMGVCHRDVSLENMLVDDFTQTLIIDLGMALRVPYDDGNGAITDVSAGSMRRLIKPLIPCGKPYYMSPEIINSRVSFDGFSIDLFAAGVILFIMLLGLPPWEHAKNDDSRYRMIAHGQLDHLLRSWGRAISPAAQDLLQRMLMEDPRQRLSLVEVRDHPWVVDDAPAVVVEPPPNEGWRY